MPVTITIDDLEPEDLQATADEMRGEGACPERYRQWALGSKYRRDRALLRIEAAVMEQYPPKPELKVGELATTWGIINVRIDFIGSIVAEFTHSDGVRGYTAKERLTPLGVPAPDDWGTNNG